MKHFPLNLLLVLMVSFTACQTSWISDISARPGDILFHDDFSDASGKWPVFSSSDVYAGIVEGEYRMQLISLHSQLLAAPSFVYSNVRVEADVTRVAGSEQNFYGLACRSIDAMNYYFFVISPDGYYALGKLEHGQAVLIGQDMMNYSNLVAQAGNPIVLRLDCIGNALSGYVNGFAVASSQDADFSSGGAGLVAGTVEAGGVDVAFDHFVVTKP